MSDKKTVSLQNLRNSFSAGMSWLWPIGVIIGGAFKTIVDSLCNDILMPFIGIFVGESTFFSLVFQIGGASIKFGSFIQAVVNFLIMALVIFCLVRGMNRLCDRPPRKQAEEAPVNEVPAPSAEEVLLTEIRDLLKEQK